MLIVWLAHADWQQLGAVSGPISHPTLTCNNFLLYYNYNGGWAFLTEGDPVSLVAKFVS